MSTQVATLVAAALLGAMAISPATAAEPQLPRDGWASWEVPAPDGAPYWCCWNHGNKSASSREPCNLDKRLNGFGSRGDEDTTDLVKIYVRTAGGRIERLQALAAACPVQTTTPVQQVEGVTPQDSARWIITQAKREGRDALTHESLAEQALAALSMHGAALAGPELATFVRDDARAEARQWAVFWLANSGFTGAEKTIAQSLRSDADGSVREHAIFSLSLLPGERAVKALIAVAEDSSLPREQRKRAVFWLSQSETDAAMTYLENVLARTGK